MSKSQETFNKKEVKKKKDQKRKEKLERKLARKEQKKKGTLDNMMAYIDENGNISDTPPDPAKKKVFKAEDIVLGVPTRVEEEIEVVRYGVLTFFNTDKGFGFIKIKDSQDSIFVHIHSMIDTISEGDKVSFETEPGQKGPVAVKVKIDDGKRPEPVKEEAEENTEDAPEAKSEGDAEKTSEESTEEKSEETTEDSAEEKTEE